MLKPIVQRFYCHTEHQHTNKYLSLFVTKGKFIYFNYLSCQKQVTIAKNARHAWFIMGAWIMGKRSTCTSAILARFSQQYNYCTNLWRKVELNISWFYSYLFKSIILTFKFLLSKVNSCFMYVFFFLSIIYSYTECCDVILIMQV